MAAGADAAAKAGTTAATTALFKAATERAERVIKGPAKARLIKALASLQGYSSFLNETRERVSTFKTFADPTKPVSLLDHFVETRFEKASQVKPITQDELINKLKRPCRIVISATAGYGKSMVMRYISLALFENPIGRIPLFLELRNLNRVSSPSIISYLHSSYRQTSEIQVEAFKQGLEGGAFAIILDGFDELNHELREKIEDEILSISKSYSSCPIVISGRPDDRFKSWRNFHIWKVSPMEKKQIVELINKLDYDKGVRKRFVDKVKNGLYDSHKSFLSTPLLAILMLLTFEQNANIPDKMHLFYGEAFKTLFHKHDALKEQYDRSRKSGLAVDEFEKVFSVFCLKTYVQEKTEFSENEIRQSINHSLTFSNVDIKVDDFLFDIDEAICLMMKEGSSYFFIHRSFQEYFTAVFLSSCPESIRDDFMEKFCNRYWDNVLPMLFDMASQQIEPTWVIKNTKDYFNEVGLDGKKLHPLNSRFKNLVFWKNGTDVRWHTFDAGKYANFMSVMKRFYPEIAKDSFIDFAPVEEWAKENWQNLEKNFDLEDTLVENTSTISVPISAVPFQSLEEAGIIPMVISEYNDIRAISKRIKTDQSVKNDFLAKLFSS